MATYYWVGGSGTWDNSSKTNWATSTGGAGGFGPPTSADAVNFDANSGAAATVNVTATAACAASTINKSDINLSLSGSPTFSGLITLTAGTLTLNTYTLTATSFSSSNSNVRTIDFGTGSLDLVATAGTVYGSSPVTNMVVSGTPKVRLTTGAAGTRTINAGAPTEAQSISFYITSGSDTIAFGSVTVRDVDFTGFTGTCSTNLTLYGSLKLASGMTWTSSGTTQFLASSGTKTLTSASKSFTGLTFGTASSTATFSLQDNVTATGTTTLTGGTLNLTGNSGNWTLSTAIFSSSNSNTRSIVFGTGNITLTGSSATICAMNAMTGFSYTGTPTFNATYSGAVGTRTFRIGSSSGATESNVINVNISAGSDIVDFASFVKNLNYTGFSGSLTVQGISVYGNLTYSAGMTNPSGTGATTFAATSGTQQITTNGKTLDIPLTFNGLGGTFAFQDALTQGSTRAFTISNGTVQLKASATSTVGSFTTSGSTQKYLQSTVAGTQATLSQASGTVSATYLTIRDIVATGGATWNAYTTNNNIDAGNNTGWDFIAQLGRYIYTRRKNKRILL